MAFILHYGRCQFDRASCDRLLGEWQEVNCANAAAAQTIARRALTRLNLEPPERLAMLGLANDANSRSWLSAPHISPSLCIALLMLERTEMIVPLPIGIWDLLSQSGADLGFSKALASRFTKGLGVSRWMKALSGVKVAATEPNAALLGGWSRGAELRKALPGLRLPGVDPAHDGLRQWLEQIRDCDWIFINAVW